MEMNNATPLERGVGTLASPLEIALERIRNCVDGEVDLSHLGLTELPPLPEGLKHVTCLFNQLTSLPTLPSSLRSLYCGYNRLTSLPSLPSLEYLHCQHNQLKNLPVLPPSLLTLICYTNQLASLPELPPLEILRCGTNPLRTLPTLPSTLEVLACELPIEIDEVEEIQHGGSMKYSGMYPALVEAVNQMVRKAAVFQAKRADSQKQ